MKVNMWNPQTRRVMYRLLKRHGIPSYGKWNGVMSPSLPGLVGSDFDHALDKVAHDMNLLCGRFLRPGKVYKSTSIKQQINFTLQQGIRAKGYQHRFGGQRSSCFENLQAATAENFITFEEVHQSMHPFIISVNSGVALPDVEEELNHKQPEQQAKEAQMALQLDVPPVLDDVVIFNSSMASEHDSRDDRKMEDFIAAIRPYIQWRKNTDQGHLLSNETFVILWQSSSSYDELRDKYQAIVKETVRQLKVHRVSASQFKEPTWKYLHTKAERMRKEAYDNLRKIPSPVKPPVKKNRLPQMINAYNTRETWEERDGRIKALMSLGESLA